VKIIDVVMGQMGSGKYVNISMRVDAPKILLDADNSVFLIEGPSYPEDPFELYGIVIQWLKHNGHFTKPMNCEFKFKVLNSASRKMIVEILLLLEKTAKRNSNIFVKWYYDEYDEDMKEAGEDLSDTIEIPFELVCH
jgi:hypothetical protein